MGINHCGVEYGMEHRQNTAVVFGLWTSDFGGFLSSSFHVPYHGAATKTLYLRAFPFPFIN